MENLTQKFYFVLAFVSLSSDQGNKAGVWAWTYHHDIDPGRNWSSARQWCRQKYTDIVAIQNQNEIEYLNNMLPHNPNYYWIGIRKQGGLWTWVGTNKPLTKESENWAIGEPNNSGNQQDCVEIYIKRQHEAAKWNDEKCSKMKGTLCYTASCRADSCGAHAECVETIGNYSCQCHPGFQGPRCEEAVQCGVLEAPVHGSLQCTDMYGPFRFNSSCVFSCTLGFSLTGTEHLHCQATGSWISKPPSCQVVRCPHELQAPLEGSMNCMDPIERHSFNSTCEFTCKEGFRLSGSSHIQCNSTGEWTGTVPACKVVECGAIAPPPKGVVICNDSYQAFSFGSTCHFSCVEGYSLAGDAYVNCTSLGNWTARAPVCKVQQCETLTAPPHGNLNCSHPYGEFSFNSSCDVSCEEGFQLNGTVTTRCSSMRTWTETLGHCQAQLCLPLVAPTRGHMQCFHPHAIFSFGSSCEIGCVEGFTLRGDPKLYCNESGVWSNMSPFCEVVQCMVLRVSPPLAMNCSHSLGNFSFGTHCHFCCGDGFMLNGTEGVSCNPNGSWSEPVPTCTAVEMTVGEGMMISIGVGSAIAVGLLFIGGILFLVTERIRRKAQEKSLGNSLWVNQENPTSEYF